MDGQQQPQQAPAGQNLLGRIRTKFEGRTVLVAIVAAVIFILIAAALYFVLRALRRTKSVTVAGSRTPVSGEILSRLPVDTLIMDNGSRMTMTFWLYLHDIAKYSGMVRHVFHVGNSEKEEHGAVSVVMNKDSSGLIVRVGTSETVIDYVPAQRWVHVTVVKQDIYSAGRAMVFLDGIEQETRDPDSPNTEQGASNITISGAMYTGGENVSRVGFSGMVGTTRFYNYDLGYREIMRDYRSGPNSSLLGRIGLGSYGFRSPVYRVS